MLPEYTNHVVIIIKKFHQLGEILYFITLPAAGSTGDVSQSALEERSQYSVEFLHVIYSSVQLCTEDKFFRSFLFYFILPYQECWSGITTVSLLQMPEGNSCLHRHYFAIHFQTPEWELDHEFWGCLHDSIRPSIFNNTADLLTDMVCLLVFHLKFYMNKWILQNITAGFQRPTWWTLGKIPHFRANHAIIIIT